MRAWPRRQVAQHELVGSLVPGVLYWLLLTPSPRHKWQCWPFGGVGESIASYQTRLNDD